MAGIQETKQVIVAANEIGILLIKLLKDGFQPGADIAAFVAALQSNEELKTKLADAAKDIQAVPSEIKDVNLIEGVQLGMLQLSYLQKIIEAMK